LLPLGSSVCPAYNSVPVPASQTPSANLEEGNVRLRAELQQILRENFGIEPTPITTLYQKPYPDYFDYVPYPQCFRIPDFGKFNGVDNKTTREHISQYLALLGEARNSDPIKVRLFPLSLTGTAFSWFSSLAPSSVLTWYHLEKKFHEHFYTGENELKLSHLTSVKQKHDESVTDYVKRFRDTKNRCYSLVISEKDMADLVLNGLRSHLKDKLEGFDFLTIGQVLQRALAHESWANETRETHRMSRTRMNLVGTNSNSDEESVVYTAEIVWPAKAKPYVCDDLKLVRKNWEEDLKCSFDVGKCDKIFDALVKEKII